MKRIMFPFAMFLLAGVTLLSVTNANAQTTYGVKLGPDFSSQTNKNNGSKETTSMIVGLLGGVYANIPIAPQFYVQPSLMYEGKGGKDKTSDVKTRLNYLTLPVDLLFKPEMPNGSGSWIVGFGPYVGYGISGNNSDGSGDPFKSNSDLSALKRFDAGANVQLGYEMANGFNIGLNAELGLINILNNGNPGVSGNSTRNTSFGIMVGYTFGKK